MVTKWLASLINQLNMSDAGSDSEKEDQDEVVNPHLHKGGTILQIKLINFMCHSSFEIEFGPKVNFVIGPNGSGKSAILTALVVAFGARAAVTSRAKKMADFVKYGEETARVIVKLHNYNDITDKDCGYKPREYGNFIIIERVISKNDATRLLIKSDKGKILSEKVGELKAILEHFRIQVENPVCILNQEVSKTFLHSKRPEDKYDLFMKATLLEQILNDYQTSQDRFAGWKTLSDEKKSSWKKLKEEKDVVTAKIEGIKKRDSLVQDRENLRNELMWSGLANFQHKEQTIEEYITGLEGEISKMDDDIQRKNHKIEKLEEEIRSANVDKAAENEKRLGISKLKTECHMALVDHRNNRRLIDGDQKRKEQELKNLIRDKKELETKIKQLQSQSHDKNSKENERKVRKERIICLESEVQELKDRESSTRTQAKHLTQTLAQLRSQLGAENSRKMDESTKLGRIQSDLNRFTHGKENSLRKFGENIIDIRKEIDRAFSTKKFRQKPIGPLGHYIKLKNKDIAIPLETHLKGLMYAFACDNMNDMQVFTQMIRKSFPNMTRPPQLIVRPFGKRHEISRYKANHVEYNAFIDLIEVENDVVFNVLIDSKFLESVLYIPQYEEAENVMMNQHLVPTNCKCAYTKDGSVMYPSPSYRSYANDGRRPTVFVENVDDQIRELEEERKSLQAAYQDTCNRCRKLSDEHLAMKTELERHEKLLKSIVDSIKSAELELVELKHVIDDRPVEITCFEDELNKTINNIAKLEPLISDIKAKVEQITRKMKDSEARERELLIEEEVCEKKMRELDDQMSKSETTIRTHKHSIQDLESSKKDKTVKINIRREELKEVVLKIADITKNLEERTKVHKPRSVDVVTKDLKKVEILLEQREEYEDPEKEMINLQERLVEIDRVEVKMNKTEENVKSFNRSLRIRKAGFNNLRNHTISKLSTTFSSVMDTMNMRGELLIYVEPLLGPNKQILKKANTLEIRVDTSYDNGGSQLSQPLPQTSSKRTSKGLSRSSTQVIQHSNETSHQGLSQHMSDTRSLSGGERSFSTVAFVLALWKHCAAPFKLLDEIDVFMDMVTRRISYNALINFAIMEKENTGQFIFFSPLELPKIQDSTLVRVFEMAPPHR